LLEVEVIGAELAPEGLQVGDVEQLCGLVLASAGVDDGHLAVEFVSPERIRELNREHRGRDAATDVLSFPVDGSNDGGPPDAGPLELGDVVICPEMTGDVREAVVHGALHLSGMDHEHDEGEMLALQAEILRWVAE
jgi:probable rRNA maturation factor